MIFSLHLITFFIHLSTSTIKSLNLNCSNNVFPFSEKATWQSNQDALDDYEENIRNVTPSTGCVQFALSLFRQTCIIAKLHGAVINPFTVRVWKMHYESMQDAQFAVPGKECKRGDLDDCKDYTLNTVPLTCCVEFVLSQFR